MNRLDLTLAYLALASGSIALGAILASVACRLLNY